MTIYNRERFTQALSFHDWPTYATDIDGLTHLHGKLWLGLEAKVEGTDIPRSQDITLRALATSLGRDSPAYFAVAHHDTRPSEDITGEGLLVSTVYVSTPDMAGEVVVHDYPTEHRPTYNQFIWAALLMHGAVGKAKKGHIPDYTHALSWEPTAFTLYPGAVCEHITPELMLARRHTQLMWQLADLDCVDDEYLPNDLKALMAAAGYEGDIVRFVGDVFYSWGYNDDQTR